MSATYYNITILSSSWTTIDSADLTGKFWRAYLCWNSALYYQVIPVLLVDDLKRSSVLASPDTSLSSLCNQLNQSIPHLWDLNFSTYFNNLAHPQRQSAIRPSRPRFGAASLVVSCFCVSAQDCGYQICQISGRSSTGYLRSALTCTSTRVIKWRIYAFFRVLPHHPSYNYLIKWNPTSLISIWLLHNASMLSIYML